MNNRRFLGGLSGGVSVFAVAGAFWIGLGISTVPTSAGWRVYAMLTVLQVGGCGALLLAAARLRRKSRLGPSVARQADPRQKAETRHIMIGFLWTVLGQMVLIGTAVLWCVLAHAEPMIWPSIGLVVSLHLIPLARIFHIRAYYFTAGAGGIISLVAFTGLTDPYRLACLCGGLAAVMWVSAVYLLAHAVRIANRALRERWAI